MYNFKEILYNGVNKNTKKIDKALYKNWKILYTGVEDFGK